MNNLLDFIPSYSYSYFSCYTIVNLKMITSKNWIEVTGSREIKYYV